MVRIFAGPDIQVQRFVVVLHQEQAGIRQIIDVEKLPPGCPAPPDDDLLTAFRAGIVELPDEGGQDMAALEVEVVARAIEVGGHRGDEVAAVLLYGRLDTA